MFYIIFIQNVLQNDIEFRFHKMHLPKNPYNSIIVKNKITALIISLGANNESR